MTKRLQTWYEMESDYCGPGLFMVNDCINQKICLVEGKLEDIIEADVIVNAANGDLNSGGGVCGVIFREAGKDLGPFIKRHHNYRCPVGDIVTTPGMNMAYKYIIHAVGPDLQKRKMGNLKVKPKENEQEQLQSVYLRSLVFMRMLDVIWENNQIKRIVFPCISTGIFAYDNIYACHLVLHTIRLWLECNPSWDGFIVLCCSNDQDNNYSTYFQRMGIYFPKSAGYDVDDNGEMNLLYSSMKKTSDDMKTKIGHLDICIKNQNNVGILRILEDIQEHHDNIRETATALKTNLVEEATTCIGDSEEFKKKFHKLWNKYYKEMWIRVNQMIMRKDNVLKLLDAE